MSEVIVVNNAAESRFEAQVEGETVGWIDYVTGANTIDLTHTEVEPGHEGEGIGSKLVRGVLERLQEEKPALTLVATCPFVKKYVHRHPEFQPLLDPR
ncbi:N-acetyltransferase [Ornithinimicrobium sp. F0845]|uniref:GNAT family N-acetyltransferase n=1 Tax=Ornithinimicrobium sp. F0845 TaxID=2926412 RepID=UPI001FF435B4|nr:GNAT family N-acetyltransferase [Ornithinimicrobium sp. F0845]MCK0112748.1 N-acetyltransferase [Ornithinimicrobium sp. F0845]